MASEGQYQLVNGDGSKMDLLRSGEADLVLTGPPYSSDETLQLLQAPVRLQNEFDRVKNEVTEFALGLRSVYQEIRRVLRPGGFVVVQTKDIYYGGFIISIANLHREMVESTGLKLLSKVSWHKFQRRSGAKKFLDHPTVGSYRNDRVEDIFIFSDSVDDTKAHGLVELDECELKKAVSPLWLIGPGSKYSEHPHKASKALVSRIIALFTDRGDLVVDPFCGSGTTLEVAVAMGRRAVGYELNERYTNAADSALTHFFSH